MKTLLLAAVLLALPAAAALTGTVMGPRGPVVGATVSAYTNDAPNPHCPVAKSVSNGVYQCLCFGKTEALTTALSSATAPKPLAVATTGADGSFSIAGDVEKTWLVITSADGTLGVAQQLELDRAVLTLAPMSPLRLKVNAEGLDVAKAKLFAVDLGTGAVDVMVRGADGVWTAGARPGSRSVVALVPGAAPASARYRQNGKAEFQRDWRRPAPEVPELDVGAWQRVTGTVTKDGVPVAGATIVGEPQGCAVTVKNDGKGRFVFEHAPAPPFLLTARASHQGLIGHETLRAQQSNTIELVKPGVLEATFVDAARKPLVHHAIDAHWRRSDNNAVAWESLETDEQGTVRVEFPGSGSVQLRPQRRDLAFTQTRQAEVKAGERTKATFTMVPAAPLDVEVVDGAGKPVEGVQVAVFFGEELQGKVSADLKESLREEGHTTDARGVTRIRALMPGPYEVEVDDRRLGRATAFGRAPGKLQLRLGDTPILKVLVTDTSGAPVEGASVHVKQGNTSHGGDTGADGVMQLALPPGSYEVSPGFKGEAKKVDLKKGTVEVKFTTTAAAIVLGTVVDPAGKPLAGATVFSSELAMPLMPGRNVSQTIRMIEMHEQARSGTAPRLKTNEKGAFSAKAGEGVRFWARAEGFAPTTFSEPKDGKVTVVLTPRPIVVGRVVDARGRPVGQALVGTVHTSADGKFRFTFEEDESRALRVQSPGRPPVTVELEPREGDRELALPDIKLEDGVTVSGRVVDVATGKPLKRARITVRWPSSKEELVELSKDDGTFRVEGAPARPLEVEVSLDRYQTVKQPAKGTAPLVVKLPALGALEVTVKRQGEPVAEVRVFAEGPSRDLRSEKDRREYPTDALGTVRLDSLAPGEWSLRFERERQPFGAPMKVVLKAGETRKVTAGK
ncbi:MAG: carboxypeptidase-like regulatory domain-containing protein [Myxococcales bacterium]|nr:carboxypeptidase-like regulatory domain-containing protein [Myxococcales bacterium]